MEILRSKTGHLKWIGVYKSGNSFLLNDNDIHSNLFQIDLLKIINLKTLQAFTPKDFFRKEEKMLTV